MKSDFTAHLTEEALNDVLIGMGSEESERHLAACSVCRAQVEQFISGVELLDATSMAWSRQRAAQMPGLQPHAGVWRIPLATMGSAAAFVLLIAIAAPVWHRLDQPKVGYAPPAVVQTPAAAQTEDSETQIAQDNALLRDIDAAVNASEAPPLEVTTRSERPSSREKARPE
ncbi:MAG: hypothetical protein P4L03_06075 [Terracidiphilus sp.]|nr:hypothetical protein [Terracidiphilus sp.]